MGKEVKNEYSESNHLQTMKEEFAFIKGKIDDLSSFVNNTKLLNERIKDIKQRKLVVNQLNAMINYAAILSKRIKYFETYEDEHFLHIVMEYIPGDNLFKMITNKSYVSFTEKDINEIMIYLLKSVLFLHHNGIVHRDIKPDNILFSVPGKFSSLKLIDFGLSIPRNSKKEQYRVGTPYYNI